jgi:hypothetical protein
MTAHDILLISVIVGITQCAADILSSKWIFETESYRRLVSTVERLRNKRTKAMASRQHQSPQPSSKPTAVTKHKTSSSYNKNGNHNNNSSGKTSNHNNANPGTSTNVKKRTLRADDDFKDAVAQVTRKHALSAILSSFLFLFIYTILSRHYTGKIVAVLPFPPWPWVQRMVTKRGIGATEDPRACGFFCIYILCTLSIKFMVHKLLGVTPPKGCESITAILDTPKAQKLLKDFGLDVDEILEARDTAHQALKMKNY